MMVDLLEHAYFQRRSMPRKLRSSWQAYGYHIVQNSPAVQEHLDRNELWVDKKVVELANECRRSRRNQVNEAQGSTPSGVFGFELQLDILGVEDEASMKSPEPLVDFIKAIIQEIGMKAVGDPVVEYTAPDIESLRGYTIVQLIVTSSIILHVVERSRAIYLNVFSCKEFDPKGVKRIAAKQFQTKQVRGKFVRRPT